MLVPVDELLQLTVPVQLLAVNVALAPEQIVVVPVTLGGATPTLIVTLPAKELQDPTVQVAV